MASVREIYPELVGRLESRRAEILRRELQARENLDKQVLDSPGDVGDESVIDTSADYFLRLANTHQREVREIDEALERIQRGTYGLCANCENPIAAERLRNLPYARHCIDCQSAEEKRHPLRPIPYPKL